MQGHQLRQRRLANNIPGLVVCSRAGVSRTRLSDIEREYVQPRQEELARLNGALDELIAARRKVEAVAAEVGWAL